MSEANLVEDALKAGGHLVIDLATGRRHVEFRREDYDEEEWALLLGSLPESVLRKHGLAEA